MPARHKQKRGSRGKKNQTKKDKYSRSVRADQARLNKAIERSTDLNRASWLASQAEQSGASSSGIRPADQQGQAPSGVTFVSVDSDSDRSLSPSDEGLSSAEDTQTQVGDTALHFSVEERTVTDGRRIVKICLSKHPFTFGPQCQI